MNSPWKHVIALGAAILVAVVLSQVLNGCAPTASSAAARTSTGAESSAATSPLITVSANSEIAVVPDKAKIGIAVTTQASTADATQSQNSEAVNAVTEAILALGVQETSIQTTDTYLYPRYDYSSPITYEEPVTEGPSDASTNIIGYEMITRLSINDLDIEQVGKVLQASIAAGATNSDGIQYYSSEYDAKYAEALAAAVEAARAKAEVLAKAAGVNLGGVYSIVEGYQNMAYRYDSGAGMAMESAAADVDMKVMPGEVNVNANVTVSYEIS